MLPTIPEFADAARRTVVAGSGSQSLILAGLLGRKFRRAVAGMIAVLIFSTLAMSPSPAAARRGPARHSSSRRSATVAKRKPLRRVSARKKSVSSPRRVSRAASHRRHIRAALRRRSAGTGGSITHATWYGPGFHGKRTASGERFSRHGFTLASRHIPLGSRVRVTSLHSGKSAIARVNDRGPVSRRSGADLSEALARHLGIIHRGGGRVRIQVVK